MKSVDLAQTYILLIRLSNGGDYRIEISADVT
jgi:hypothetical protein